MARALAGIVAGAAAGAAGTTGLNVVSYLLQAYAGTPGDVSTKQTAEALADRAGTEVPGDGETADNRKTALGNLAGIGVGVGLGAAAGLLRAYHVKIPKALAPFLLGFGAMGLSDGVMTKLGVTDPHTWTAKSVTADAIPHLVYGLVQTATLHRMLDPRTPHAA